MRKIGKQKEQQNCFVHSFSWLLLVANKLFWWQNIKKNYPETAVYKSKNMEYFFVTFISRFYQLRVIDLGFIVIQVKNEMN